MLQIIHAPVAQPDPALPVVPVRVERLKLSKRVWRGPAQDGAEFGCELEKPLRHGDTLWQNAQARYVIEQEPEAVLEISLQLAPSAAAGIGWAVGNLHLELMAEPTRLLTPDERAARQLLERIQVAYRETTAVFRPGRFARGGAPGAAVADTLPAAVKDGVIADELGQSHKH
jgi:urease accessory protein